MEDVEECDKTQIEISKYVKIELISKKIYPRESYEDVLRRILKLKPRIINGQRQ